MCICQYVHFNSTAWYKSVQLNYCYYLACVDPCLEPGDIGPCRARILKYYYNAEEGSCAELYYGGCGGNGNRFESFQECTNVCGGGGNNRENDRNNIIDPERKLEPFNFLTGNSHLVHICSANA